MDSPTLKKIILASNSPRRRQLLSGLVDNIEIAESRNLDETYPDNLKVEEVAPYISLKKANGYSDLINDENVLVTADTVVIINNKILGKPKNRQEAFQMLKQLSGNKHNVITGVTLKTKDKTETFSCDTLVEFDNLSDEEIWNYVDEYRPFDKAGSYGIQEWIGFRAIKKINGCFYNVMGLPLNLLHQHLKNL